MSQIYNASGVAIDLGVHDEAYYENLAKTALTGKVWIAIGDSYTAGMNSQLSALATKYGMVLDNRGVVSATIAWRSTSSNLRMYNTVNTVVTDYTNGKTIGGTTYHAEDVGVITFMGGANDDAQKEAWIGSGTTDTNKSTIYGSLHHIFQTLLSTFTNAKVVVATQPSNGAFTLSKVSTDDYAQKLGFADLAAVQVLNDFQLSNVLHSSKEAAVKEMAWCYGIPVTDIFDKFPSIMVAANRDAYWVYAQDDHYLHLTSAGYDIVADAIEKKVVEVVTEDSRS